MLYHQLFYLQPTKLRAQVSQERAERREEAIAKAREAASDRVQRVSSAEKVQVKVRSEAAQKLQGNIEVLKETIKNVKLQRSSHPLAVMKRMVVGDKHTKSLRQLRQEMRQDKKMKKDMLQAQRDDSVRNNSAMANN